MLQATLVETDREGGDKESTLGWNASDGSRKVKTLALCNFFDTLAIGAQEGVYQSLCHQSQIQPLNACEALIFCFSMYE
jgi:hypothetical protein